MKVSPYFFKSEKGKLAIVVSGEALAKVTKGMVTEITGTATTSGKDGKTRRVDATARPSDNSLGALKLWFISGDRKMVFDTSHHFLEPWNRMFSPLSNDLETTAPQLSSIRRFRRSWNCGGWPRVGNETPRDTWVGRGVLTVPRPDSEERPAGAKVSPRRAEDSDALLCESFAIASPLSVFETRGHSRGS